MLVMTVDCLTSNIHISDRSSLLLVTVSSNTQKKSGGWIMNLICYYTRPYLCRSNLKCHKKAETEDETIPQHHQLEHQSQSMMTRLEVPLPNTTKNNFFLCWQNRHPKTQPLTLKFATKIFTIPAFAIPTLPTTKFAMITFATQKQKKTSAPWHWQSIETSILYHSLHLQNTTLNPANNSEGVKANQRNHPVTAMNPWLPMTTF